MPVWDVLGKRTAGDEFVVVGGVKAPDAEMALVLARETHFRHKEGVAYAVRRRGESALHVGPDAAETLRGVTDHSYRRQEAYAGVGGKLKRIARETAERGAAGDRPPPQAGVRAGRGRDDNGTPPFGMDGVGAAHRGGPGVLLDRPGPDGPRPAPVRPRDGGDRPRRGLPGARPRARRVPERRPHGT